MGFRPKICEICVHLCKPNQLWKYTLVIIQVGLLSSLYFAWIVAVWERETGIQRGTREDATISRWDPEGVGKAWWNSGSAVRILWLFKQITLSEFVSEQKQLLHIWRGRGRESGSVRSFSRDWSLLPFRQSAQRAKEELEGRVQLQQAEREALKIQVSSLKSVQQEKQQVIFCLFHRGLVYSQDSKNWQPWEMFLRFIFSLNLSKKYSRTNWRSSRIGTFQTRVWHCALQHTARNLFLPGTEAVFVAVGADFGTRSGSHPSPFLLLSESCFCLFQCL